MVRHEQIKWRREIRDAIEAAAEMNRWRHELGSALERKRNRVLATGRKIWSPAGGAVPQRVWKKRTPKAALLRDEHWADDKKTRRGGAQES
jgi:hypothetical protein